MKQRILFLFIISLIVSCSSDDDATVDSEFIGNWILIEMSTGEQGSETTGSNMEWQETYKLNADGTFLKSRTRNGVLTEVSGTYLSTNNSNSSFLELNFDNENDIVGSCLSEIQEVMNFQSETIFINYWDACDGARLTYEKVTAL